MHENSDFLRLVVNSIRKDLDSNNEVDNCLALHAIANVGGSEMAEALAEDVHRLLISPYVANELSLYSLSYTLQYLTDICEEESCADFTAPLSQAPRGDSRSGVGVANCIYYG